jgi:glycosyltransferase involved in cell wall biosynthesis
MACGVPIVTSNRAALPEVVGEAGLLVEPSEPESIAAGVARLLEDDELGAELRRRGVERARDFGWDRTAELTWRVLSEAAAA